MKIVITYCVMRNYKPKAVSVATRILEQLNNVEISLDKGAGGIFDVSVDGQLVFSKRGLGISKVGDVKEEDVVKEIEKHKEAAVEELADAVKEKCR